MASVTMSASFSASTFAGVRLSKARPAVANRVGKVVNKHLGGAGIRAQAGAKVLDKKVSNRRDLVFGATTALAFLSTVSAAREANAEELKKGSPEAKKFYKPVCVTMPTAKICHK